MDSLISASARALAAGDALGALKRVALRDDAPALALRGIAMAQLGELARARDLLRRAARAFGAHEDHSRARCVVAEAEIATFPDPTLTISAKLSGCPESSMRGRSCFICHISLKSETMRRRYSMGYPKYRTQHALLRWIR